ncbi:ribitol-5-phosphate xylosyltransferase 1-like [Anneissia japonica]|uniref:ribitol-5-phosphate xylosyltransferase 1-like n=1 Tax=Anneissia japonica TaxID=1529436 RepID=UPI001425ABF2|nr:ribitol-5-phosphate xylosyltransferase 1-like [Anneissia japonica]
MRLSLIKFGGILLFVYCIFSLYTLYLLYDKRYGAADMMKAKKKLSLKRTKGEKRNQISPKNILNMNKSYNRTKKKQVEIWGKAAIGNYLWEHILEGKLEAQLGGIWTYGSLIQEDFKFKFRTGPGVVQSAVPQEVENLVLVLNGRTQEKIDFARSWLDYLPHYADLKNIAVVLLGNEQCNNDWILQYLTTHGGLVKLLFITYDTQLINDKNIFQWPLGVATYRGFPVVPDEEVRVNVSRPYVCNFLGTIYPGSSREDLMSSIRAADLQDKCFIKARLNWEPLETTESLDVYKKALATSDFTLNPVGVNTECYRLYEAMSYGSIPIVEDTISEGACDKSGDAPLRLLRRMNAPFVYIKDWKQIPEILKSLDSGNPEDVVQKRRDIVKWYQWFKQQMKVQFLNALREKFTWTEIKR